MMRLILVLLLLGPAAFAQKDALLLSASFDKSADADFAVGERRIHTATSYAKREDAQPGLHHPDAGLAPGKGRNGSGALEFRRKNTRAVYYSAERNVNYLDGRMSGTISFWLSLDPEKDLEPGFCDPIQLTDKAYNDSAVWVDFTKDEKPRHFRLGVFGDLKVWNPQNLPADKFPAFNNRLVVVQRPPFAAGKWTHVVITFRDLGSGKGSASLYLDGKLQGSASGITERFEWNPLRAALRLGVNYVGLMDDVAIYSRPLTEAEIARLR